MDNAVADRNDPCVAVIRVEKGEHRGKSRRRVRDRGGIESLVGNHLASGLRMETRLGAETFDLSAQTFDKFHAQDLAINFTIEIEDKTFYLALALGFLP